MGKIGFPTGGVKEIDGSRADLYPQHLDPGRRPGRPDETVRS